MPTRQPGPPLLPPVPMCPLSERLPAENAGTDPEAEHDEMAGPQATAGGGRRSRQIPLIEEPRVGEERTDGVLGHSFDRSEAAAFGAVQPLDGGDQRSGFALRSSDGRGLDVEMLPKKAGAEGSDGFLRILAILERHVALGIEAHGAVIDVARPDPQQSIIDDEDLGVDVDLLTGGVHGREDAEPAAGIGHRAVVSREVV